MIPTCVATRCPYCGVECEFDVDVQVGEDTAEDVTCENCEGKFLLEVHCEVEVDARSIPAVRKQLGERRKGETPEQFAARVKRKYPCSDCGKAGYGVEPGWACDECRERRAAALEAGRLVVMKEAEKGGRK